MCFSIPSIGRQYLLTYGSLIFAVLLVYSNVYNGEFLMDDVWAVAQNSYLRSWSTLPEALTSLTFEGAGHPGGFHRPVLMFFWFLVFQMFGASTVAYHALNVFLHIMNTLLMFGLGRRLGFGRGAVFGATLLWALHPVHTEAVTYISGTGDLLYGMFCLLGLHSLLPDFKPHRFLWAGLLFLFALGSKESAVVFPALVMITMYLVGRAERLRPSYYIRTWPLWLIAAGYLFWIYFLIKTTGFSMKDTTDVVWLELYGENIGNRVLTFLSTLPVYLKLLVWPETLHINRSTQIVTELSPAVWGGLTIVALAVLQLLWGQGRRGVALSWGLLWCAISYAPNSGIVFPVDALVFEHWLYVPTIGLALGMGASLDRFVYPKPIRQLIAVLLVVVSVAFATLSYRQNMVWHNMETLMTHNFQFSEHNELARNTLGVYYTKKGELDKAIEQFEIILEDPAMLPPGMLPAVHMNLALAQLGIVFNHDPDKSVTERFQAQYDTIRRTLPLSPGIHKAIPELEIVIRLDPNNYWAYTILGMIYDLQGDQQKSLYYHQRARSIKK